MGALRRHPVRTAVAVVLAIGVVVALVERQQIGDVYGYLFPDGIVDDAGEVTSDPAPVVEAPVPEPTPPTTSPTRTSGAAPAVELRPVAALPGPSAVVDPAGPGPVLATTLDGRVLAVDLDDGSSQVVLDLRDRVSTGGERGLLGMAIAPDETRLFLNLTNRDGDTEVLSVPLRDGRPEGGADDLVLHLRVGQPYRNHNGGHLAFGPDGALWIGLGDGGSAGDPAGVSRDPGSLLGKMLRVVPDAEGGVRAPDTNPRWGGRPEVWAIGLRNPWRYSFDRGTGLLWVADVGQDAVEEVSVVDPSATMVDFGWDLVEGSRPSEGEASPAMTMPVVEYGHDEGCSVTGGYVYRGEEVPSLRGWYVFGDFCGGWVRAVPSDRPRTEPVELAADLGAVISFAELEDGELLVLGTDGLARIERVAS